VTRPDPHNAPPPLPAAVAARALEKQERLAKVYDAEVLPVYAQPFASMLLQMLDVRPGARVVEVGCATGALTLELLRLFDDQSRLIALDEAPAFIALAQPKVEAQQHRAKGRATWRITPLVPLPLPDRSADVVVSNLAVAQFADPGRAVRELGRVLAPGGQVVITVPLRESWHEFVDIYRDVLRENGRPESLGALDQHLASLPDAATAAGWLEAAGLTKVEITVQRWEILFKSAREFFFAPLVELGPLSRWKRIAGRGDDMQDVFFFTKEAIDTYFKGTVFATTIAGAALKGWKKV
jgi:ubiquinone/menaquinone biosynthesis C-methylase UbiE